VQREAECRDELPKKQSEADQRERAENRSDEHARCLRTWGARVQQRAGIKVALVGPSGDALRCEVKVEHLYGHDNELLMERYTVLRVREVMVNRYIAEELPFDAPDGDSRAPDVDD